MQDFFSADIGSIRDFTVIITTDVPAPSAVKTVSGQMIEGGLVEYQIDLTNPSTAEVADAAGDELTDFLPAGLSLVSATATSGTAVADVATNTVTWNGALAANGGMASVTVTATVNAGTAGTTIENQATVSFDSDGDGTNETSMGSAPAVGAAPAPTTFTVGTLALTKTAGGVVDVDGNGTTAGDTISYSFTVTNNTNVILTDVAVDDPLLGGAVGCPAGPLAPGTSVTCGPVTYVLTESDLGALLVNTATASASADGIALSAVASVQTPIPPACSAVPTTTTEPTRRTAARRRRAPDDERAARVVCRAPRLDGRATGDDGRDDAGLDDRGDRVDHRATGDDDSSCRTRRSSSRRRPTEVPEPTVDSSVAVTESSDVTAPLGFAAAPAQVDPCAPPPSTSAVPTSTTPATAPRRRAPHQRGRPCRRRLPPPVRLSAVVVAVAERPVPCRRRAPTHGRCRGRRRDVARRRNRPRRRMAPARRTALIEGRCRRSGRLCSQHDPAAEECDYEVQRRCGARDISRVGVALSIQSRSWCETTCVRATAARCRRSRTGRCRDRGPSRRFRHRR